MSKVSAWWVPRYDFWRLIKSTLGWSYRKRTWLFLKQIHQIFLNVSSLRMSVASFTRARDQTTIHAVETPPLLPLQRRKRLCHRQGRWWLPSSGMQRVMCSLTTFRNAKLSSRTTMPTCWGSCERQSSQNGSENWRRESCFTRTMLLHTRLRLQWLLCVTVGLIWLITLHILLTWHHLTILCSPTWKTLLYWEAVSDRWWSHNLISVVEDLFKDQDESFYTRGIQALQQRWKKWVDRRGDNMFKVNHIWSK